MLSNTKKRTFSACSVTQHEISEWICILLPPSVPYGFKWEKCSFCLARSARPHVEMIG